MSPRDHKIASHQTVRLSPGKHEDPSQGVCVMELASMLAGEPFTDRPRSVCPVVGAFLRTYNDLVDDARRQDLYRYAAEAVGTSGDPAASQERMELCRSFLERYEPIRPGLLPWLQTLGAGRGEALGRRAATAAVMGHGRERHAVALTLLDALMACGRKDSGDVAPSSAERAEVVAA